jgi:metal transporter CNNM
LDPKDAKPVRELPLNRVIFVPQNELLLGILDRFQEGRSHIAVVTRFSKHAAESVKQEVKQSFSKRLKGKVGVTDSDNDTTDDEEDKEKNTKGNGHTHQITVFGSGNEQNMPADAVLPRSGQNEIMRSIEPGVQPLGIITLEDVLEGKCRFQVVYDSRSHHYRVELIGEEIYDEFDPEGAKPDYHYPHPEKNSKGSENTAKGATSIKQERATSSRWQIPLSRANPFGQQKSRSLPHSGNSSSVPPDGTQMTPNSPQLGAGLAPTARSASPMPVELAEGDTEAKEKAEPVVPSPRLPSTPAPGGGAPLGIVLHERARQRQPSFSRSNTTKIGGKGRLFKSVLIEEGNAASSKTSAHQPRTEDQDNLATNEANKEQSE